MAFAEAGNSSITNTNHCGVANRDDLLLRAIRWQVNWMNDTTQPDPAAGDLLQNGKLLTTDMMKFLRDCVNSLDNVHIEMIQSFATMIDKEIDQNEVPSCGTTGELCKPFKKYLYLRVESEMAYDIIKGSFAEKQKKCDELIKRISNWN
jgi:hypothetical protein